MTQRDKSALSRRQVLLIAPAVGAQAAWATPAPAEEADPAEREDDPRRIRFRETEHMRTYYRLARG